MTVSVDVWQEFGFEDFEQREVTHRPREERLTLQGIYSFVHGAHLSGVSMGEIEVIQKRTMSSSP